jgi:hypothetical protein
MDTGFHPLEGRFARMKPLKSEHKFWPLSIAILHRGQSFLNPMVKACRPYATPSSISFFYRHLSDAHTAEDESVKSRSESICQRSARFPLRAASNAIRGRA